ncbi:MAG: hypothetical protein OXG68_02965 [Chloroflexi bacterium]|nr:hypothetical protein [Chloroflexota bacterium]
MPAYSLRFGNVQALALDGSGVLEPDWLRRPWSNDRATQPEPSGTP